MPTELQKKDLQYNWHPYVQHKGMELPIVITKGKDAILWDEKGNKYIDAIASWWANPHGHCNVQIANAITLQINELEHILFGGYTHPKAIELSEKLLSVLPSFDKVFYSDNGSTSIEVALKMAMQFFLNQNKKKLKCVAYEGAFHGDTFGAMSVSGISLFSDAYKDVLLEVERIPTPNQENWNDVKNQFIRILNTGDVFGFIFEPLVQGANGMKIYEAEYLDELIQLSKQYNVITIADEVMTGFGRTGKLFAIDYLKNSPDIICLSKALTGGFIPLSTTICKQFIFDAFYSEDINKALFHGHTFMANPAGCAAALASLEISTSIETQNNIFRIQEKYTEFQKEIEQFSIVKNCRNLGVIFAFEVDNQKNNDYYGDIRNLMYKYFLEHKIILRPIGNTLYFLPPYCITDKELDTLFSTTIKLLKQLEKNISA